MTSQTPPRVEPPHSDDVEIVGWSTELPRKSEDEDEVEFVDAPSTTKAAAEQESGDIEMEEADAPPPGSTGPTSSAGTHWHFRTTWRQCGGLDRTSSVA